MLIDDPSRKGTNKNVNLNQSDDDDYEDNGSGIEDDAPEGFQALQRPEQPIITFPDLLRVPTTTANMQAEDDSPESLSFASAGQSVRPNELLPGPSATQRSISDSSGEPIGGLPRNRRPLSHPDVSQMNLPSSSSSSSGMFTNSAQSSSTFASQPTARPLPPLPGNNNNQNSVLVNQGPSLLSRNSINNLNLPLTLDSPSHFSSPSSSQSQPLAPILHAISRIQSSVETLSRQFNERLDGLENRINEITSTNPAVNHLNLNQMTPEFLRNFIQEQKREMHNQRRSFVLSFAEALRFAAEPPTNNGSPESSHLNNHYRSRPN